MVEALACDVHFKGAVVRSGVPTILMLLSYNPDWMLNTLTHGVDSPEKGLIVRALRILAALHAHFPDRQPDTERNLLLYASTQLLYPYTAERRQALLSRGLSGDNLIRNLQVAPLQVRTDPQFRSLMTAEDLVLVLDFGKQLTAFLGMPWYPSECFHTAMRRQVAQAQLDAAVEKEKLQKLMLGTSKDTSASNAPQRQQGR